MSRHKFYIELNLSNIPMESIMYRDRRDGSGQDIYARLTLMKDNSLVDHRRNFKYVVRPYILARERLPGMVPPVIGMGKRMPEGAYEIF